MQRSVVCILFRSFTEILINTMRMRDDDDGESWYWWHKPHVFRLHFHVHLISTFLLSYGWRRGSVMGWCVLALWTSSTWSSWKHQGCDHFVRFSLRFIFFPLFGRISRDYFITCLFISVFSSSFPWQPGCKYDNKAFFCTKIACIVHRSTTPFECVHKEYPLQQLQQYVNFAY